MDTRSARVQHWIQTGDHKILTDNKHAVSNESELLPLPGSSDEGGTIQSSSVPTTSNLMTEKLFPLEDDILIPCKADVDNILHNGRDQWSQLITTAKSLPPTCLSAGRNDPSLMLQDVPALPARLPKYGSLAGRPCWHIPDESTGQDGHVLNRDLNFEYMYGARKDFCLSYQNPVECRVSTEVVLDKKNAAGSLHDSPYPPGLLLLTLCWSYIFSVRFWELQGKDVMYTSHALQPRCKTSARSLPNHIGIHLGASASASLTRWICALLAPKPGWSVSDGGYAPWAAFCSGGAEFVVILAKPSSSSRSVSAPTSAEAVELLIELNSLYGFGPSQACSHELKSLPPIVAGFLAVLTLPLYRLLKLQPQFLAQTLQINPNDIPAGFVRQYATDLRYYMTLSMSPISVGSIIWSIFWHPDVECNVVSPWLGSILTVLRPLIEEGNVDMIAKAFALLRPRVGLWWVGMFLLGSSKIPDLILRYLETSEERWGYGTLAIPDTTVSSWTGSPQSFLDETISREYVGKDDAVLSADLLRCRYNFRLQDTSSSLLSWKPFGKVPKAEVEPDIWPCLKPQSIRTYKHWTWYIGHWRNGEKLIHKEIQRGFRCDNADRFVEVSTSHSDIIRFNAGVEYCLDMNLEPSGEATLRMIHFLMEDVTGDRDAQISIFPGVKKHRWLKGWRGLEA